MKKKRACGMSLSELQKPVETMTKKSRRRC
jgi:hypothetical protein